MRRDPALAQGTDVGQAPEAEQRAEPPTEPGTGSGNGNGLSSGNGSAREDAAVAPQAAGSILAAQHPRRETPRHSGSQPLYLSGLSGRGTGVLLVSAMLGAILGSLLFGRITPHFQAVALVQGAPARLNPSALSQEDDRYAQTEAAYAKMTEADLATALAGRLPPAAEPAEVSVVPGTTILRFTGTGDTPEAAAASANVSAEIYVEAWRGRTTEALVASLGVINGALAGSAPNTGLLADERADLDTQLAAVQSVERVLKPATAEASEPTSNYVSGALLGGLVGLTIGVAGLLWYARTSDKQGKVL